VGNGVCGLKKESGMDKKNMGYAIGGLKVMTF
jgi:hypothetical protein